MGTVLLTGFEPFDDFADNPALRVAEALHGARIAEHIVESLILPVEFGRDAERVLPAIENIRPHLVLSLGLAAAAPCIWVERIALNLRRDECGEQQIIAQGPAAYFARLDAEAVACAIRQVGVPAVAHVYAGNYLCNHLMYQVLHCLEESDWPCRAGFLHLPISSEQAVAEQRYRDPSLPLSHIERGVRAAIESACTAHPVTPR